ncbi:hypothetical protein TI04_06335 [Achromatium sp. WMS2]|nr:hypothetical protein TI04_06335 [Achromatium sp. WMS2]
MDLNQLNDISLENAADWPMPVKIAAVVLLVASIFGALYFFDTQEQQVRLEGKTAEVDNALKQFSNDYRTLVDIEKYRQLLEEMKQSFESLKKQLPEKTEIASLLVDLSQTGLANGLEFELFRPNPEVELDDAAETPISITVTGTFHQFGNFVSGVASLPRIVTIHDVSIQAVSSGNKNSQDSTVRSVMNATAKTYRYKSKN